MAKEKKNRLQRFVDSFLNTNLQYVVAVFLFLLLFLTGARFDVVTSLVIAGADTLFVLCSYQFFSWLFMKQPVKSKSVIVNVLLVLVLLIGSGVALFFSEKLILLLLSLINPESEHATVENNSLRLIYTVHFFKDILMIMGALSMAIYKYSAIQKKQAELLEQEKQAMKLQLLKSQINPHFLFNALNNIYTLVYTKNDIAPDALIKLSDMLRYVTDQTKNEYVPIDKELSYIQNYLDFQIMRLGNEKPLSFHSSNDNHSLFIIPMIIQPLVENCFTHGDIMTNPKGFVDIDLAVHNVTLSLSIKNSRNLTIHTPALRENGGVGFENVIQRLKLYYPNNYSITINDDNPYIYQMHLTLNLLDHE